ncbi:glycosyltransferase family 4 protein [Bacillus sp. 2205SS5-2]|uniref:glycosyltransferase family 4 protein n=1 Tax=Bacillus sp. 2205SS5-2 TaxID=3109031 RepID=UPI0030065272
MDSYYNLEGEMDTFLPMQHFGQKKSRKKCEQLKILYVTFFEYPHTGGLSNYITSIKRGFQQMGHDVDVLAPNQMSEHRRTNTIPLIASQARDFLKKRYRLENEKIVKNLSYLSVFQQFLSENNLEKYDVIHAQDLFSLFILGQLNQQYQKPLFFTPHGLFTKSRLKFNKMEKGSIEEAYFSEIEKQGIQAADEIILISDSFRPSLIDYGASEEKMTTVHTGIDYQPLPKKENEDKLIITTVARLSPRKGQDLLIRAIASLRKELLVNVELWIIGDGVMRKTLTEQVKSLQLDNVIFFGKRTDIAELLALSDLYVLATINDNFPLSVMEAMFSKQAIISTTCGGIPEMIQHEKTGILCEPGNVEELAIALERLIQNQDERRALAAAAEIYASQHLTTNVMTSKIHSVYSSYF